MDPQYFTLFELVYSHTAQKNQIANIPSFEQVEHLKELGFFLDTLREAWGGGISINSGYRCPILNQKVGGVDNSIHKIGYAADIYPKNGKFEDFKKFITEWIKDKDYDQCIIEKAGKSQWVHIGLYNNQGEQRKQCFKIAK